MLAPVVDTCQKPGCRMRLRPRIAGRRGPSGLRNKRSEPESTRCKDCLAPVYGLSRIRLTLHSIAAFSKGHSRDSDGFEPPEGPNPPPGAAKESPQQIGPFRSNRLLVEITLGPSSSNPRFGLRSHERHYYLLGSYLCRTPRTANSEDSTWQRRGARKRASILLHT